MAYPDDENLTLLATLKGWVPIEDDDTAADGDLSALIVRASRVIALWLGRPRLFTHSVAELRDGNGCSTIMPRIQPVSAVTSVTVNGSAIDLSTAYDMTGYYLDAAPGLSGQTIVLRGLYFPYGKGNVSLVYEAGFATNGREQEILEQACLELCNRKWQNRDHTGQTAQGLGNQVWAKFSEHDIPEEVRAILQPLRRTAMPR